MEFIVSIICPDGPFTTREIRRMIDFWFKAQQKKGIAYRVIYTVKKRRG